jgi:hypothetical protein
MVLCLKGLFTPKGAGKKKRERERGGGGLGRWVCMLFWVLCMSMYG